MRRANILFLDSYTQSRGDSDASDEIGYGISASTAIKAELRARGIGVDDLASFGVRAASKLEWVQESYRLLREVSLDQYDAVFIFHIFHQFPSEIRRILFSRRARDVKLVGYTHGSHWDASDTFRERFFPGMRMVDLGNLLSLDRVFVVSNYFRRVLLRSVRGFSAVAASDLRRRLVVTGLPINSAELDHFRTEGKAKRVRILFNHSPTPGKAPEVFFRSMRRLLALEDVDVVVTRRVDQNDAGYPDLSDLRERFGGRIQLGNTMPRGEYCSALWSSHIQVSTALHESLGMATLEAMYAGNCCLLPDRQCYPEIAGRHALYSSDTELLYLLQRYIHDAAARQRAAARMHSRSLRYLPKVIVARIAREIEPLLESRSTT